MSVAHGRAKSHRGRKSCRDWEEVTPPLTPLPPHVCMHAKLLQSCPTLFNPVDCSLPGSSVHWLLQVRILEWVAKSSSRGIFPTQGSNTHLTSPALAGWFFTTSATWKPPLSPPSPPETTPSLSANTSEGVNPQGGGDNGPNFPRYSNHG